MGHQNVFIYLTKYTTISIIFSDLKINNSIQCQNMNFKNKNASSELRFRTFSLSGENIIIITNN